MVLHTVPIATPVQPLHVQYPPPAGDAEDGRYAGGNDGGGQPYRMNSLKFVPQRVRPHAPDDAGARHPVQGVRIDIMRHKVIQRLFVKNAVEQVGQNAHADQYTQ